MAAVVAAALIAWADVGYAEQATAPSAPPAAGQGELERGLGAFRAGKHEAAIADLNAAAAAGDGSIRFIAEFFLARIYAADAGPAADHTKAFALYRKLADENLTVDPLTSQRAPFVAKALIALAGYVRAGVKAIDLPPNPRRAVDYLHHAAVFFGDRDAQLLLATIYLRPDAAKDDVRRGLHFLAVLAEESHGPAQAALAELFWHGRHVAQDLRRALALASMAVENAPPAARLRIEESYAAIFCAANQITRAEAGVLVARWRQTFLRPDGAIARTGAFELLPARQCASGERVALSPSNQPAAAKAAGGATAATGPGTSKAARNPAGFKAAGIAEPPAKK